MKKTLWVYLLGLWIISPLFSQDDADILEIRARFNTWQPVIENKLPDCEKHYNFAWGENYQYDKWVNTRLDNDTLTLHESISIIPEDELGTYVYREVFSFSGDWFMAIEYYFDLKDALYFIFWKMNTFYAEEPVTVEKRLYFDKNGEKIRELQSVYKMNTKEKTTISFMDREVEYKPDLKEMDFYKFLKKDP